ncbi:dethiobiotin synthase, partial [Streptomyces sp. SID8455]|nr:dethiobiotin synthase [Streptomyces sp. SID8455]
ATALTAEAARARGLELTGTLIGGWPEQPGLAERCNTEDLAEAAGAPLLGAVPWGAGSLSPEAFRAAAPKWLAPELGGRWDAAGFRESWAAG